MKPAREFPRSANGGSELKDPTPAAIIRVVVLDDQNLFRDGLIKLISEQPDMEVVGCTNDVAAAAEHIRKLRPHIALMGWSGSPADAQKIFLALEDSHSATRMIMLVSDNSRDGLMDAVRNGCCGIVSRRTSTELLLKSIRKVHDGEFWLDRATTAEVIRGLAKRAQANQAPRPGLREHAAVLSQREMEIVALVAQGFKNKEMAERMFISEQTVKNHLHNVFDKLGVSDRLELALYAIHHNLHEGTA
jgi:two-component system, NarL family, nitrate/nitrite response regulator NarL